MKRRHILLLLPLLLAATGCASSQALGSLANPVGADMPPGQRAYLQRLRCPDGERPAFQRMGSMGINGQGHVIDGYEVRCAGRPPVIVHMNMYRRGHVEQAPPPGFAIDPPDR